MYFILDRYINEIDEKYNITKDNKNEQVQFLENLMDVFDTGLPCQNSLLDLIQYSSEIKQNKEIKIIVESCKVIYY